MTEQKERRLKPWGKLTIDGRFKIIDILQKFHRDVKSDHEISIECAILKNNSPISSGLITRQETIDTHLASSEEPRG